MVNIESPLVISKNNPVPGEAAKFFVISKNWSIDGGSISWILAEAT
jgi:hypothetical protein